MSTVDLRDQEGGDGAFYYLILKCKYNKLSKTVKVLQKNGTYYKQRVTPRVAYHPSFAID